MFWGQHRAMPALLLHRTMSPTELGSPLALQCGLIVPNRIAKSATSEGLAVKGVNAPNKRLVRLYTRFGKAGLGIVLTGNVQIDRRYMEGPCNVAVEDERDLPVLMEWAKEGQRNGSMVFVQISHPGRQCPKSVCPTPISPSAVAVKLPGSEFLVGVPREMTEEDIQDAIARFGRTAGVVKAAGFAGVQLHGAHGYLISEFLNPLVNKRRDKWGGNLSGRMKFLREAVRRVRKEVGRSYPISVKLNVSDFQRGGMTVEEAAEVAAMLEEESVDLLELSGGNYESPPMKECTMERVAELNRRSAYFLEAAKQIKEKVHKLPLMVTGGWTTLASMKEALQDNKTDMIGIARPLCVEPGAALRLLEAEKDQRIDGVELVRVEKKTMLHSFDHAIENLWHMVQLHRMADGLDPYLELSVFPAVRLFFKGYIWRPSEFLPYFTVFALFVILAVWFFVM